MCRDDENLLYNMARVLFHRGDKGKARHYLTKALELRRDFPEANEFIEFLDHPEGETGEKKQTPWSKPQQENIPERPPSPNAKDADNPNQANQDEQAPPPPPRAHQSMKPNNEAEEDALQENGPEDGKDGGKARPRWQKIDLEKY